MMQFKAFKPQAMNKIAQAMGYQGDMNEFQQYVEQDPARQQQMNMYNNAAVKMAAGGYIAKTDEEGKPLNPSRRYRLTSSSLGVSPDMRDAGDGSANRYITIGSAQDTAANRMNAEHRQTDEMKLAFHLTPAYKKPAPKQAAQPEAEQPQQNIQQPQRVSPSPLEQQAAQQQQQQQQQASLAEAARRQDAGINQSVYQAPYLSNTRFTPAGQYVQDPNTLQMTPQAYTPLNQGYGSAAANFQNNMLGSLHGTLRNVSYNPNNAGTVGNLAGSVLTQNMAQGGAVPPRRTEIKGQDHMLAYITPQEGELLKAHGGSGRPGPMGIPSFEGDGAMHADFYQVPVGQGADATSRRIYIGSSQDTVANRQISGGTVPLRMTGGRPVPMARDVPYEVAAAANPNFAAAQEALAARQAAAQAEADAAAAAAQQAEPSPNPTDAFFTNAQLQPNPGTPGAPPDLTNTQYVPLNQGYAAAAQAYQNQLANTQYVPQGQQAVQNFASGGQVTNPQNTQAGTPVAVPTTNVPAGQPEIGQFTVEQMYQPGVPIGGTTIAAQTPYDASQDIAAGTGTLTGSVAVPTATAAASQAQQITPSQANTMQAAQAAPAVDAAMQATQAAQANPQDPRAQVTAAQQTASSVGNLQAAQGNASLINNPVQRQIQQGELITGAADAAVAANFTEQIQAAQTTPTQAAMVQGQLDGLMQQFVGGNTPAWASGAIRSANAAMAARGLGASSLAGQAIVQAAMESALPIAQADAQIQAQFEGQNLSNRQQIAMLAAQQRAKFMGQEFDQEFQTRVQNSARIGDIANMNFTAEQQVQLENSRATNTMNLNNLSNSQAMVMAEASALAQLDTQNLNNRQQSAVQNAQSFLQTDMANLSNQQQTDLFKAQQRVQSMFTDQAATNAAAQFNASSQNQVDQFFQQLGSQVSQFNATQANAQAQYNAGQTNTVNRFNAELNNQRDQYNANNQMVIAQANAQWRRQIATADTAAVNSANELNANAILDISKQAYSNLWNFYGDTMEWAWTSAEKELDRYSAMAIAELDASTSAAASSAASKSAAGSAIGGLIGTIGAAIITCWVAREVYGKSNPEWFIFRTWLEYDAPKWFKRLYVAHGENYAKLIAKVPPLKWATKQLMDMVINKKRRKHNVQTV